MEFEQLITRLDWLDEQHRKDKAAIETLSDRLKDAEGQLRAQTKKNKELAALLSSLATVPARLDQFDQAFSTQRSELARHVDDLDHKRLADEAELDKRYQLQFDGVNKSIAELKKLRDSISEIKREAKARTEEDTRRNKLQAEWEARMQTVIDSAEDVQRSFKSAETGRRQDAKRLADAQGEISALRKRLEDTREKSDLLSDGLRRTETRLNEILASEAERKQAQTAFFENQARLQVERDRMWKEWEENLGSIRKQTQSMDRHLQDWDTIQRAVKRAQETYEEIIQKFERRINEITEMQRLAEDRFRQELVSFKADDQKRWTSYTLSQEESLKDARTEIAKVQTRLTQLEDLAQTQQDILQQTKEANQQLFQGLLAQIHELLSAYERIMSVK